MHQNIFNPISLQIKREENAILVLPMLSYTGSLQPAAQPLATSHWMMSAPLKKQSKTLQPHQHQTDDRSITCAP
jgi:hypothetical protein